MQILDDMTEAKGQLSRGEDADQHIMATDKRGDGGGGWTPHPDCDHQRGRRHIRAGCHP